MLRTVVLPILLSVLALVAAAQTSRGGSPHPDISPSNTNPASAPAPTTGPIFVSGKVVSGDSTPLAGQIAIESVCNERTRIETYTDSRGHFSFQIKNPKQPGLVSTNASETSPQASGGGWLDEKLNADFVANYLRDCRLRAYLPGFASTTIELGTKSKEMGATDVGTLVMHRLAQVEGSTVSVTTAQAPPKAKKEYDEARVSENKGNWNLAEKHLLKAVQEYPQFAIAWWELGRVQARGANFMAARQSFHHAISADAKFISPYHDLAVLAAREQRWQEVVDTSNALLKLNSTDFPEDWWLNSVGNYSLRNFNVAQTSALRGLELDKQHQVPRLEYMLGLILAQKGNYPGALEHIRNYLRLAPLDPDSEDIRKQANDIVRIAQNQATH